MRLWVALLLLACLCGPAAARADQNDLPERDEVNESFALQPGASITITDISGSVDIETTAGSQAEVHIVRSARSRADLEHGRIDVVHTATSLEVRSAREKGTHWGWNREVRQRVLLRLPRRIDLAANDISGRLTVGDIDGSLHVNDISGSVTVGSVSSTCEVFDVSGRVSFSVTRLGESGIRVNDVSGSVTIGLPDSIDAALSVTDISGGVSVDIANVKIQGKLDSDNYHATIGAGGPPITIYDISGSVRLSRTSGASEQ